MKRPFLDRLGRQGRQPPSGGCVLKPLPGTPVCRIIIQPPSGGCVLKHRLGGWSVKPFTQPPSGGCVLKLAEKPESKPIYNPAAFRRLCVETRIRTESSPFKAQPPSGGCVLKRHYWLGCGFSRQASRLQAAVC